MKIKQITMFRFFTFSFVIIAACWLLPSCNHQHDTDDNEILKPTPSPSNSSHAIQRPSFNSRNLSVKTFEVTNPATGKSKGWGYDILVDGHATIHQPILPGLPGNKSFSTEEKARQTGIFALDKMKQSGGLPTLSKKELDSLGVTK